MALSCSDATFRRASSTTGLCYSARVLLLGCWVAVKVLLALYGRIMGAVTVRMACSPPFFVDPFVSLVRSLGGGGGLAMEAHLVVAGSVPVLGFFCCCSVGHFLGGWWEV